MIISRVCGSTAVIGLITYNYQLFRLWHDVTVNDLYFLCQHDGQKTGLIKSGKHNKLTWLPVNLRLGMCCRPDMTCAAFTLPTNNAADTQALPFSWTIAALSCDVNTTRDSSSSSKGIYFRVCQTKLQTILRYLNYASVLFQFLLKCKKCKYLL